MKAIKAFIKPFGAPQRSVKTKKINLIFISIQLSEMHGLLRVKSTNQPKRTTVIILLFSLSCTRASTGSQCGWDPLSHVVYTF